MGASGSADAGLQAVRQRAEQRAGKVAISGRYHCSKSLEDDYEVMSKVLGTGYNGQVHMARRKGRPDQMFAVKAFKLIGVSSSIKTELENEAEIFLNMDHPHVARLVDVFETPERLSLVMECMDGGELFYRIKSKKQFSEHDAAVATHQMLLAVSYLHSHHVIHRDLKLENFLYQSKDSDQLKLIDFGFSKIWEPHTKLQHACGTLAYVAPEVLRQDYDFKCDMWSLGVCVFILLLGYMPFSGTEPQQKRAIKSGDFSKKPHSWNKLSKPAENFLLSLLVVRPETRMDAKAALAHPWLEVRHGNVADSHIVHKDVAESLANFAQASAFKRTCLGMMAWSLSKEERDEVREEFLALDEDDSGTISIQEFKRVLEDMYHLDDHTVREAFEALDVSHQEEIHYSDFLAATVSTRIKMHDDLLLSAFKRFDTTNSGAITAEDLREVLGDVFDGESVEDLLEDMDSSHSGKVTYEQFIYYLQHHETDSRHADAADSLIDHLHDSGAKSKPPKVRKKQQGCGCAEACG